MKMPKKFVKQFKIEEKIKILKQVQEEFDYHGKQLTTDELSEAALKKMSRYARFVKDFHRTATAVTMVGESVDDFHDTHKNEDIAHGFHFGSVALSIYNFFRVPFMYLSAYMLNQPVPFNLTNNARWLYSGVLLALSITAIAAPVTAPIIAFVSAGIGFAASSFFLGKLVYERYKLGKESRRLDEEIKSGEATLENIQQEAKQLEQSFEEITARSTIIDASIRVDELSAQYEVQKAKLEKLYDQKLQNEQLKEQFGVGKVLFKSISLILATATIVGLVVSLFFPPVGMGILAGVAVAGAALILGKVMAPVLSSFGQWLKSKWSPTPNNEIIASSEKNDLRPDVVLHDQKQVKDEVQRVQKPSSAPSKVHESTTDILCELGQIEKLEPVVPQQDKPPVVRPSIFSTSPSPSPSISPKQKKGKQDDDASDTDTEHEGLIHH